MIISRHRLVIFHCLCAAICVNRLIICCRTLERKRSSTILKLFKIKAFNLAIKRLRKDIKTRFLKHLQYFVVCTDPKSFWSFINIKKNKQQFSTSNHFIPFWEYFWISLAQHGFMTRRFTFRPDVYNTVYFQMSTPTKSNRCHIHNEIQKPFDIIYHNLLPQIIWWRFWLIIFSLI